MIAVLYDGKKEKRRIPLDFDLAAIREAVTNQTKLVIVIPLRTPCAFNKLKLYENGAMLMQHHFGVTRMVGTGSFEFTLDKAEAL